MKTSQTEIPVCGSGCLGIAAAHACARSVSCIRTPALPSVLSGVARGLALARKSLAGHGSVYSAVGNLPSAVYREIARVGGVQIYYEGRDPVYIESRLIDIHMQDDTLHGLRLPSRQPCRLEELFDGGEVRVGNGACQLPHQSGATKLYLVADAELEPTGKG